jgi:membrane associated rhomboid family serine protease
VLPLRDNIPSRTTPVVNWALIGITGFAFLMQLSQTPEDASLVERFGMIPARITHPGEPVKVVREGRRVRLPDGRIAVEPIEAVAAEPGIDPRLTMLTCIFLHGGWMHFIGNMWFLFIFGDNVEDRFGHVGYLVLYLAFGVAASLAHFVTAMDSTIPTIGASGAIAGVMGAYLWLYPHSKVLTLVPIFVVIQLIVLPAPLFLGIWFVMQSFQGIASITSTASTGVAWWAHIGGFAAGFLVALVMGRTHHLREPVEEVRPRMDHNGSYRQYRPW